MRLLCVDDEADIRTILGLALSLDPTFEFEIVADGASLLARASDGPYDAFVLDGMMPGLDGYETCRRLKENPSTAAVPVVFLTARSHPDDIARARELGAAGCLQKPFDPMLLASQLRAVLAV